MTGDHVSLAPDTRKRRITSAEHREDAHAEYLETLAPTLRAWWDAVGPCIEVNGVPVRRRDAYADERPAACWADWHHDYREISADGGD